MKKIKNLPLLIIASVFAVFILVGTFENVNLLKEPFTKLIKAEINFEQFV